MLRIFPKLKGTASPGRTHFEIAQHGVDPDELRQISRFEATCDDHHMHPSRLGYTVEAKKAIREDLTCCIQSRARPVFYVGTGESFPTQIGILGLYGPLQRVECFAFQHGLHELVMDASGRGVTDAELSTQRQSGQLGFRLADQVYGQKPEGQRPTRSLKEGSGNQRSLMATMAALT